MGLQEYCAMKCRNRAKNRKKRLKRGGTQGRLSRNREEIGKCESCGFANKLALHSHHVNNASTDNSAQNIIVLCANCHYTYHGTVGWDAKTENQTREYVLETLRKAVGLPAI